MDNNFDKNGGVVAEVNLKPDIFTSVPNEYVTPPTAPTLYETAEEFPDIPSEYGSADAETAEEVDPNFETAAVDDDYNNFDDAYRDKNYTSDYCKTGENGELCEFSETGCDGISYSDNVYNPDTVPEANKFDNVVTNPEKLNAELAKDYRDSELSVESNSDNETAATNDNCYNCGCGSDVAQEKCKLDDYEIISDVLGCEKELVKLYSTALCEAAEEPFRDIIRENLTECAADQYKTFEFMESRGMYNTEQATEENITKAKQQFTKLCD